MPRASSAERRARVDQLGPGRVTGLDGGQGADRRHPAVGVVGGRDGPPGAESLQRRGEGLLASGAGRLANDGEGVARRQLRRHEKGW